MQRKTARAKEWQRKWYRSHDPYYMVGLKDYEQPSEWDFKVHIPEEVLYQLERPWRSFGEMLFYGGPEYKTLSMKEMDPDGGRRRPKIWRKR